MRYTTVTQDKPSVREMVIWQRTAANRRVDCLDMHTEHTVSQVSAGAQDYLLFQLHKGGVSCVAALVASPAVHTRCQCLMKTASCEPALLNLVRRLTKAAGVAFALLRGIQQHGVLEILAF